jgi:hypothetical protein
MTGYMQGSIAQAVNQWRNEASEANKQVALWREHALNLERKLESALQEIATLKGNPKPTLAVENLFEEEVPKEVQPKKVNTSKKKKINESGGMGTTSDHTTQVQISEE